MTKQRDRWRELCASVKEDDGLPLRNVGRWTEDKLFYWHRYVEITTSAMVDKPQRIKIWRQRARLACTRLTHPADRRFLWVTVIC